MRGGFVKRSRINKETLRAMACVSGLKLNDNRLDELVPHVQRMVEALEGIDLMSLENIEPALMFAVDRA